MQFSGKTVEEAITNGLNELGITASEAKITVVNDVVKGLFGKIKTLATVEIEKEKTKEEQTAEFTQKIAEFMGYNATTEISESEDGTVIKLITTESSNLIGYRGEVLDAIQALAGAYLNIGNKEYKKVVVDCEDYRAKRKETLISLAKKLEAKATDMRREVMLEPMSPYERRIIHTTLSQSTTCTTKSEGKEPNRYVVIVPNDKDEFSVPYNAGRNKAEKNNKGRKGGQKRSRGFDGKREKKSGFGEVKKKSSFSFGTYLGNSLKDK